MGMMEARMVWKARKGEIQQMAQYKVDRGDLLFSFV